MIMTIDMLKKLTVAVLGLTMFAIILTSAVVVRAQGDGGDVAGTYKAKCAMCHGQKAEKSFDAAKDDAVLADAVLKGVKPKMPSYDHKLAPEQVKNLVAHMKSLGK